MVFLDATFQNCNSLISNCFLYAALQNIQNEKSLCFDYVAVEAETEHNAVSCHERGFVLRFTLAGVIL